MIDQLVAATAAYRAAQQAVVDAQAAVRDRRSEVPTAREALAAAIVDAARAGVRQADIVRVTGYTRESIRRICRAGGVEPPTDD